MNLNANDIERLKSETLKLELIRAKIDLRFMQAMLFVVVCGGIGIVSGSLCVLHGIKGGWFPFVIGTVDLLLTIPALIKRNK